ncbi:MAG: histidine kinase [Actinomycetota bacterium]
MRLVTVASIGVYVFTCLMQCYLIALDALNGIDRSTLYTALLSAVVLALHCWHVRFGLRGQRPPHGLLTLVALWVTVAVGQVVIGDAWAFTFALAATSAVLVLPMAAGLTAALCFVATVWALQPYDLGYYFAVSTAYRSVILVSVVWFVALIAHLDQLRVALARDAITDERERIGLRLADALGKRLIGLTRGAGQARALLVAEREGEVGPVLQELAGDARDALDETRRIVTDLRGARERGELRAARALLTSDGES